MIFDPIADMNAIDGAIADLAARTDRPQGYPFSKITVYSVCPEIANFMPSFNHVGASEVPSMRKLDFKKAGKVFGSMVQEMKNDLSKVPEEFIITASRFDAADESTRKTTGCRKYMVQVECQDQEDRWLAIQFRKAIKQYVTEDLRLNIVPAIFKDTMNTHEEWLKTGKNYKEETPVIPRVTIILGNCSERLYQSLEKHGEAEFSDYPITLNIPSRSYICNNMGNHSVKFGSEKANFSIEY